MPEQTHGLLGDFVLFWPIQATIVPGGATLWTGNPVLRIIYWKQSGWTINCCLDPQYLHMMLSHDATQVVAQIYCVMYSLWFLCHNNCFKQLLSMACWYCTSDPPGISTNGARTWMILLRGSFRANGTLDTHVGTPNMYLYFLSALFWGNAGT